MKLYLVSDDKPLDEGGYSLLGIYTTRELADEAQQRLGYGEVQEYFADVMPKPLPPRQPAEPRELSPLESLMAQACNKYIVGAFERVTMRWLCS